MVWFGFLHYLHLFLRPLKKVMFEALNLPEWHLLGRQLGSTFILGFCFVSNWRSVENKMT